MKNVGQCFYNNPIKEAKLNQGAKDNGVAAFHRVKPDAIVGDGRIFLFSCFCGTLLSVAAMRGIWRADTLDRVPGVSEFYVRRMTNARENNW